MDKEIIKWDIYEISSVTSSLEGVMLRGRIRKFAILNNMNLLTENASDDEGKVRFAIIEDTDVSPVLKQIKEMVPDSQVVLIKQKVPNPVLSKLKVNIEERYSI
ncbi:MAG TPA: hypothetical protein VKE88_02855 [Candidatus Nanoarchaeia archaeon]|nr:hypothetical protein [Candidatus Nanoarchaeia archaeon]